MSTIGKRPLPFDSLALLLQGGGALGAYQGGIYEALAEADLHPDWVAGISIGGINVAIIAGNPPERRVEKLRAFWEQVSSPVFGNWPGWWIDGIPIHPATHDLLNKFHAAQTLLGGAPGFFTPRFPPPWCFPPGSPSATSWYDTTPLIATLEKLVDFERINAGETRLSVGTVNARTGNFVYFDNQTDRIGPLHIMASGALPPGFPAIEIEGEHYWDGGLVSNTPLQWVVGAKPRRNMLAFQVDLWSAVGDFPADLSDVSVRQKEIQYSSRTRAKSDELREMQKIRSALRHLMAKVPAALRETEEARLLRDFADFKYYNLVQLIYRSKHYEGNSKDYQFSRLSMTDHWRAGYDDAVRTLRHKEIFEPPKDQQSFQSFDFSLPINSGRSAPSQRSAAAPLREFRAMPARRPPRRQDRSHSGY